MQLLRDPILRRISLSQNEKREPFAKKQNRLNPPVDPVDTLEAVHQAQRKTRLLNPRRKAPTRTAPERAAGKILLPPAPPPPKRPQTQMQLPARRRSRCRALTPQKRRQKKNKDQPDIDPATEKTNRSRRRPPTALRAAEAVPKRRTLPGCRKRRRNPPRLATVMRRMQNTPTGGNFLWSKCQDRGKSCILFSHNIFLWGALSSIPTGNRPESAQFEQPRRYVVQIKARGPRPTFLTPCYHWICITPCGMCTPPPQ